jgi:hypothetical protein
MSACLGTVARAGRLVCYTVKRRLRCAQQPARKEDDGDVGVKEDDGLQRNTYRPLHCKPAAGAADCDANDGCTAARPCLHVLVRREFLAEAFCLEDEPACDDRRTCGASHSCTLWSRCGASAAAQVQAGLRVPASTIAAIFHSRSRKPSCTGRHATQRNARVRPPASGNAIRA